MNFLKKAFVGLFGVSIFSAGGGWFYVLLNSKIADGTGGIASKGFLMPIALFIALVGAWIIWIAFKPKIANQTSV